MHLVALERTASNDVLHVFVVCKLVNNTWEQWTKLKAIAKSLALFFQKWEL